jgi:hypothetical protein
MSEGEHSGEREGTEGIQSQGSPEISPCGRVGGCCGTCKEEQAEKGQAAAEAVARAPSDSESAPRVASDVNPPARVRRGLPILKLVPLTLLLPACGPGAGADAVSQAQLEAALHEVRAEMEDRFSPGLHSQMLEMQHRHAALWFAGDRGNWGLADYMIHELEELVEDMEQINPVYREVQVAELLREMTVPAIERMEDALEAQDRAAFAQAYDQLTTACNACHVASDRAAIFMQRPTAPPLTNLRYAPER